MSIHGVKDLFQRCEHSGEANAHKYDHHTFIETNLFPNPFNSELTLTYQSGQDLTPLISVKNAQGVVLRSSVLVFKPGEGRIVLSDLADLPPGAYFITISDPDSEYFFTRLVIRQ